MTTNFFGFPLEFFSQSSTASDSLVSTLYFGTKNGPKKHQKTISTLVEGNWLHKNGRYFLCKVFEFELKMEKFFGRNSG